MIKIIYEYQKNGAEITISVGVKNIQNNEEHKKIRDELSKFNTVVYDCIECDYIAATVHNAKYSTLLDLEKLGYSFFEVE